MEEYQHRVLKNLMQNRDPDIRISIGNAEFGCHKDLLVETSDYFRAIATNNMREGRSQIVHLDEDERYGITAENFKIVKMMIYEGKVEDDAKLKENIIGIILLINYLQMPGIRRCVHQFVKDNISDLPSECIGQIANLPIEGPTTFKQMAVNRIREKFNDFFETDESIGYKCDFETFLMVLDLDSEEVHLQETHLLETAMNWMRINEGWRHASQILRGIRFGCISPANVERLIAVECLDEDFKSHIQDLMRAEDMQEQHPLMYQRREKQVAIENSMDTEIVVGLNKEGPTLIGHMWDENNQEWIQNGFRIQNCISNIVVRTAPITGAKSLIFLTNNLVLWELQSGSPTAKELGRLPEVIINTWKYMHRSTNERKAYLHYCGDLMDFSDVSDPEDTSYYLDIIYLIWGHRMVQFDFHTDKFDIIPDLPGVGRYMGQVQRSVNSRAHIGNYFYGFGLNSRSFIMTYIEHAEHDITASGMALSMADKVWVPFQSAPDTEDDDVKGCVYILNLSDLVVKAVVFKGVNPSDDEAGKAKLKLKHLDEIEDDPFRSPPPLLFKQDGITFCIGNDKVYTVYEDCLLDTGVEYYGFTRPDRIDIPEPQLKKNPAFAELKGEVLPPTDFQTVTVLPLGLCRNFYEL